jgi:ribosomal protein S18 acetylase RimI-like enzyme
VELAEEQDARPLARSEKRAVRYKFRRMHDQSFTLREATTDDAELLARVGATLFEQTFGAANSPEDMASYLASTFTPENQSAELGDDACVVWIAEDETGTAVGYATLWRDSRADSVAANLPAEIQRIYADQAFHGRGLGKALMNACVERARAWGCDVIWLAVWQKNPRAIAFYEKEGYRRVGEKTFQLGSDTQHDYVMARNLSF